jgi:hypothetical protein
MRTVLSSLAGILVAGLTVATCEEVGVHFYPPPENLNINDMAAVAAWVVSAPLGMLILLVIGWGLGPFAGCLVATTLARTPFVAYIVGSVAMSATLVNLASLPHPWWMWPAGIVAVIAGTAGGGAIGVRAPKLV